MNNFAINYFRKELKCCLDAYQFSLVKKQIVVFLTFLFLGLLSLQAQNDTPCEGAQRWLDGAAWLPDGSIDDNVAQNDFPKGIIKCGSSAETQSQVAPYNSSIYDSTQFEIDVSSDTCIDPSTGLVVTPLNPTDLQPIIWLNFDVRPQAGSFQIQINDNSGDTIAWALYISDVHQAGTTLTANGQYLSGDCSQLHKVACGVESSSTWNTIPINGEDFLEATNFYLAVWDQDADGDVEINNFKARFGCGDGSFKACSVVAGTPEEVCNNDGTFTINVPIEGINGEYVGYDANAINAGGLSNTVCLTNSGTTNVTTGTISLTYNQGTAYSIQIFETTNSSPPTPVTPSASCDHPDPFPGDPNNGNADDCIASVSGEAPVCCQAPSITCPADVEVECDESTDPTDTGSATSTEGCGTVLITSSDSFSAECGTTGIITRTWTATDENGDTSSCDQLITITDLTPPVPPAPPADLNLQCASEVPPASDLKALDACEGEIDGIPNDVETPGNCPNSFSILRTWTFTDECGNASSVSQTITVNDDTAPVPPAPPADLNLQCASDVPAPVDLTAVDNCDGDITVSPTANITPGACTNDFVMVRTWTFTDTCGNSSSVSQTITVNDDTAPVPPAPPADLNLQCASDVPAPVDLTAVDNCDGDITVSPTANVTPGACTNDFVMVRTWTFTDVCGNTSSVSQTITVNDDTAPVPPAPPADLNLQCASDVPAPVDLTAVDNCDGDITVSPTANITPGACTNDFVMVRTWTFIDVCGNTSSVSQTITVNDDTAPVPPAAPADLNLQCASDVPAPVDLTAVDNCDGDITVSPTANITPGACTNDFVMVRTWTFTDVCGNTSSVSQTITVNDDTAPVPPAPPADLNLQCASDVPAPVDLTAVDNCDGDITVSPTANITPGACTNDFVIVRTWTFIDVCGNTSSVSQTITVNDDTAPVPPAPPADLNLQCASDVPAASDLKGIDNCDGEIDGVPNDVLTPGNCPNNFSILRTWTFTDGCGNQSSVSQTITVNDDTPPVITCPPNVSLEALPGLDTSPAATGTATATDNCGGDPTIGFTDVVTPGDCIGQTTITRTWTATDECGNQSSCDQIITVGDDSPPTITCPPDVVLECVVGLDTSPANTGTATATDSNDPNPVVTFSDQITPGNCAGNYTIIRTWTATDDCGNQSSCDQTIEVQDTTAPVPPAAPSDLDLQCASDVPPPSDIKALDACQGEIEGVPNDEVTPGNCPNSFSILRTWTFTDACGNSSSVSQTITVNDDTAPVPPAPPADLNLQCASDVPAPVDLTAVDNCDGDITVSPTANITPGACTNDFVMVRTWTFIDVCGNTSSVSQTITVNDDTAPVPPAAPADLNLQCASDVPAPVDLTAVDNCDGDITVSPTANITPGACTNDFVMVRTWTFTDVCGNTSSVSQTITVNDDTAPVPPAPPADLNLQCASDVPAPVDLTAVDNCDGDITVSPTANITPGACTNDFVIVRTWTFIDVCGNTSSVSQTITVNDDTAPVPPAPPADLNLQCASDVPAASDLKGIDNCDGEIDGVPNDVLTPGNCPNNFSILRTWTFTDGCGNQSSVSQTITVNDDTPPVITCPPNVSLEALPGLDTSPAATGTATATDNCGGDPTIGFTDVVTPGDCIGQTTITRTWTATDECGNQSSCDQIITVGDDSPPTITCPPDVVLECVVGLDTSPANTGTATATDSNDPNPVVTFSDQITPGNCAGNYTIIRTWTATDDCGNQSSCDQTIEVQDTTAPVPPAAPSDLDLQCASDVPPPSDIKALDACQGEIEGVPNDEVTPGNCPNSFSILRTWTFTDACGNSSSVSQTITVNDDTVPVPPAPPADLNLQCASDVPPPSDLKALDNCDGEIDGIPNDEVTPGNCPNSFSILRTWTFTDDCDNQSSVSQIITVNDDTAPVLPAPPADIEICEDESLPAPVDLTAVDNCDGDITVSPTEQLFPESNGYTLVRTWTFLDVCGNTSSVSQNIYVEDLPEITAGDPICSEALEFGTYSVEVFSNGESLTSTFGDVANNGGNSWTVSNIPNGQNITITASSELGCESTLDIEAPDCICIELDFDWTNVTCLGQNDGTITVNYVTPGAVVKVNGQPHVPDTLYPPGDYLVEAYFEGGNDPDCYISEAFEIFEPEAVTVQATATDVTCPGAADGTITVFGLSPEASYVIQKNGIGPDLSGQAFFGPGFYIITATVSDEFIFDTRAYDPCQAVVSVTISESEEINCIIIPGFNKYPSCDDPKYNYLEINTIGGASPFTFSWSMSDSGLESGWSLISGMNSDIVYFEPGGLSHGNLICEITDANGCIQFVQYTAKSLCEDNKSANNFDLYPNPVKGILKVDFKKSLDSDTTIQVFDLLGNITYSDVVNKNDKAKLSIDFSGFPGNVYYVKFINKQGTIIKKVVLDR